MLRRLYPNLIIWIVTIYLTLGIDPEKQRRILTKARAECAEKIQNVSYPTDGLYCNMTFDNLLCWNYTVAGTVAKQRCPSYIYMFTEENYATRICQSNGTWSPRPGNYNSTSGWTNFSQCVDRGEMAPAFVREHMHRWRTIYNVGYSISIVSLIIAITILLCFKISKWLTFEEKETWSLVIGRLRCPRNRIHVHLFFAFAVRASMCVYRDRATVQGVAFESDLVKSTDGTINFNANISHGACKALYTIFYYSLVANYTWVMVEGIYLYSMLFCNVLDPERYLLAYICFGWLFPVIPIGIWVCVRYFTEDYFCWNTHSKLSLWIFHVVIISSIVINAFFFVRIIVLIFKKLYNERRSQVVSLLRLVKSMLILIPLFGIQYTIILFIPDRGVSDTTCVARNYLEHIFNSFQGFVVSVLFCFMNSEVQMEIKDTWARYMSRQSTYLRSRTLTSIASFVTREHSSGTLPSHDIIGSGRNGQMQMDTYGISEHQNSNDGLHEEDHIVPLEQAETSEEKANENEAESAIVIATDHTAMLPLSKGDLNL